jgi:hypothetical protein
MCTAVISPIPEKKKRTVLVPNELSSFQTAEEEMNLEER